MADIEAIRAVAVQARSDFENNTIDRTLLRDLYAMYAFVPDMNDFLDRTAAKFPEGNCGLASVYLRHMYGRGVPVHGRYDGLGHTVLKLEAENVGVDITADQYGGPTVYVGKLLLPWEF